MQGSARRRAAAALLGGLVLGTIACGERTVGAKTVVVVAGDDADYLVPGLWSKNQGRVYSDLMFEKLADIGMSQNTIGDADYQPRLATRWTWAPDSLSIAFHLDPRARWQDSVPVRANDVRFAFQLYTDPRAHTTNADLATNIDSVSVTDSLTATVWYKRRTPEQFHSVAYNLVPLPEHLLATVPPGSLGTSSFALHPVGDGPFRFVSWDPTVRFELAAFDNFFRGRPKLDRVVFAVYKDASAAVRAVYAGDADFVEIVPPDEVAEAARHPDVRLLESLRYEYGFMMFNLRAPDGKAPSPIFADRGMRRALTMALDRRAIVRNVYDSLATFSYGPFTRRQWTADTTIGALPYDTVAANRTLNSLGWTRGADGVRVRGGRRLAFTITVAATNPMRPRMAELAQQQFARVGAAVKIELVDGQGFGDRLSRHTFDVAFFSLQTTPSPAGLPQFWKSNAYHLGRPTNAGGYTNPYSDAELDTGLTALSLQSARKHVRAALVALVNDPPAIWLYEPALPSAANRRLVTGPFPPDAWWQAIPGWDVTGPRRAAGTTSASP